MTLDELMTKIKDDLIDVRVTDTQIVEAVNEAMDYYKRMTFWFTNELIHFDSVINQEYYTEDDHSFIPSLLNIDYISFMDNKMLTETDDNNIQSMVDLNGNNPTNGVPAYFAYVRESIRVYPTPTLVGRFKLAATEKTLTLTAKSHTNSWLTNAPELIRQSAKGRIALNKFNSPELAQGPSAAEARELNILLAETRKRSNIKLKVDDALTLSTSVQFGGARGSW